MPFRTLCLLIFAIATVMVLAACGGDPRSTAESSQQATLEPSTEVPLATHVSSTEESVLTVTPVPPRLGADTDRDVGPSRHARSAHCNSHTRPGAGLRSYTRPTHRGYDSHGVASHHHTNTVPHPGAGLRSYTRPTHRGYDSHGVASHHHTNTVPHPDADQRRSQSDQHTITTAN